MEKNLVRVITSVVLLSILSGIRAQVIQEPGIIVVEPSYLPDAFGRKLSLSCVGYGEPYLPEILWTANGPNGIINFNNPDTDLDFDINIHTMIISDDSGFSFVLSVLELCDVNYMFYNMYDDFQCHALSSNITGVSTIGKNYSEPVSLIPLVYEPATLLAAPTESDFVTRGPRLSATCVAYGSPQPDIYWEVNDEPVVQSNYTNIFSSIIRDNDSDYLVISILEICGTILQPILGYVSCTARNGVTMGADTSVQSAFFMIQPKLAIDRYEVQVRGVTAEFTFIVSIPVTLEDGSCFMNKFRLRNGRNMASESFTPRYPGTCSTSRNLPILRASLDPRDFLLAIQFFFSINTLFIQSISDLEQEFVPGYDLWPIEDPMSAAQFIENTEAPQLTSFDVDLRLNQVILHFSSYVDVTTLNSSQFTLRSVNTSNSVSLSSSSQRTQGNYSRAICISLSSNDMYEMRNKSVCTTTASDCAASFPETLIQDFNYNYVISVDAGAAIFNVFKLALQETIPDLYMEVFLQYVGCNTSYILSEDEIYSLRDWEMLTRVECLANGVGRNINPTISFHQVGSQNSSIIAQYVSQNWPRRTAIDLPNADGSDILLYGLYSCNTLEIEIQNYVLEYDADETGHLFFPMGNIFEAKLYDSIGVPFVVGGVFPPISFLDRNTFDVNDELRDVFRGLSDFKGEFYFERIPFSLAGNYNFSVFRSTGGFSMQLSEGYFSIEVVGPTVAVVPPVVVLSTDTDSVHVQCIPSSLYLPVIWTASVSLQNLTSSTSDLRLSLMVPQGGFSDGTEFICNVLDPEFRNGSRIVADARVTVQSIPRKLVIYRGNVALDSDQQIITSSELSFQCIGQKNSNESINIYWRIEESLRNVIFVQNGIDNGSLSASFDDYYANLTLRNQFIGSVTCLSTDSSISQTVIIVQSITTESPRSCSGNSIDSMFKLTWDETPAGFRNAQPCSLINDNGVEGFAFRQCLGNATWESYVNVSDCQTTRLKNLRDSGEDLFSNAEMLKNESLSSSLSNLTSNLITSTAPSEGSLFPQDLETTNFLIRNILIHLPRDTLQTGLIDVFNNTLDSANEMGWIELNKINMGTSELLSNIEDFSSYLSSAQTEKTLTLKRTNIIVSSSKFFETAYEDILFPESTDMASNDGQVQIAASVLRNSVAVGTANTLIRNFENLLPPDQTSAGNDSKPVVVGTVLISVQVLTDSGRKKLFGDDQIKLGYTTQPLPGARSPACAFWNESTNKWDTVSGIQTDLVSNIQTGENKTYRVNCSANHATAFAVLTTLDTLDDVDDEFNFTIPVYVGFAAILFSSAISIILLLLSCATDSLRRYSAVAFLTHMSFCSSLICAVVAFWAGIELALVDERACITTAAALHFFFTAGFSWLLCEALVIIFYPLFSKYCWSFIIIFVIGWILPAIPTAISLGVLRDEYTTSSHCWFFFDGTLQNSIVLAFLVPKIAIILVTLLLLLVGFMTTCYRSLGSNPRNLMHLLRITWCGMFPLLLFLSAVWVFVLLLVNVYGIDSTIAGWVFMAASLALAICMFILFFVISMLNKSVAYEEEEVVTSKDAKSVTQYEMTTTTVTETVEIIENPAAHDTDDDDGYVDMKGNTTTWTGDNEYVEMRSQIDHGLEDEKKNLVN